MKTIAVFFCIVTFACIQATSELNSPQQTKETALKECIQEKKADPNKIKELFKNDILPENDLEFNDFFECFWKRANVIKPDGSFNNSAIQIMYPQLIRERYPKVSEEEAQKLTSEAVENCINVPKGESIGLKGIQYRNCLTKFVLDKLQ